MGENLKEKNDIRQGNYRNAILESGYISTVRWILIVLCASTIIGLIYLIFINKDGNIRNFAIAYVIMIVLAILLNYQRFM